jgi:GT2 family glycosyltransferase
VRSAVITIVSGRKRHLARQLDGLRATLPAPAMHVVVALDMSEHQTIAAACPRPTRVIALDDPNDGLGLSAARNLGAETALSAGAELLVFLDVDCIPGPALLRRYQAAADHTPALLCGPVAYLPPAPPDGYAAGDLHALGRPHPARPVPRDDGLERGGDHTLFWTLSFAVTAATWRRVGGFCEEYAGYGGEDTDFGQLARRTGVDLCWVGGAWAYHQHHASESPPVRHLADIVRNAAVFHRRWGWWPMRGWLDAFADRGLAHHDAVGDRWVLTRP